MTDPRELKKRGLGRGLSALMPDASPPPVIERSIV
jgi:hypothetical protein